MANVPAISVIWYDPKVCEKGNETAIEILKTSVGYVKMLKEKEDCDRFFRRDFYKKPIVMITTGQLGKDIIPKISGLTNIISFYIYCENQEYHKEWAREYPKIKAVVTTSDELIDKIISDQHI